MVVSLWVDEQATKSLEAVHRRFLKSLLGVISDTTPSRIVLAEFGRFPIDPILASASTEIQSQDVHLVAIPLVEFGI